MFNHLKNLAIINQTSEFIAAFIPVEHVNLWEEASFIGLVPMAILNLKFFFISIHRSCGEITRWQHL